MRSSKCCPSGPLSSYARSHLSFLPVSLDPRILIFDEATSALDYESERIIQQNMPRIATGRTVFVIAHRLSTVRRSDRIMTIDRGRLVEDGTHDELINSDGRYASLYRLQAGVHEVR